MYTDGLDPLTVINILEPAYMSNNKFDHHKKHKKTFYGGLIEKSPWHICTSPTAPYMLFKCLIRLITCIMPVKKNVHEHLWPTGSLSGLIRCPVQVCPYFPCRQLVSTRQGSWDQGMNNDRRTWIRMFGGNRSTMWKPE